LLIDLVNFSGETDMLKARLKHNSADLTIVYEGDKSYTGLDKPLVGIGNLASNKVIYLPIVGETSPDPWANEYAQRRKAFEFLLSLDLPDDAILIVSDVDEFPDVDLLKSTPELSVWYMAKFQMSARWFQQYEHTSISGQLKHFKDRDIISLFWGRANLNNINAGWHLSSFLTLDELIAKWLNFSHQELVRPDMTGWVTKCWVEGLAVENGNPMSELESLESVPEAILAGPEYWFRGRNDS
jgi:hypothetical protein